MTLPKLQDLDVKNNKVLLRLDLDTNETTDYRIQSSTETLDYLKEHGAEIIVIGHRGRPEGKFEESLSLKAFQSYFDKWNARVEENLRFDKGEEENDPDFTKKLASLGEVYVNEAFASSHRNHASIVGLPKLLPHAVGLRFEKEIENLSRSFDKPLVFLLSGFKKDKLDYLEDIKKFADKVLIGGKLPDYMGDLMLESVRLQPEDAQVVIGNLTMDKLDITLNTVDRFTREIEKAKTIIVSGPMGKFEDEGHRQGTIGVFNAVKKSSAFKIAGGGDTEMAISELGMGSEFDWISVGGGAMLEFLTKSTLPAIEAMK